MGMATNLGGASPLQIVPLVHIRRCATRYRAILHVTVREGRRVGGGREGGKARGGGGGGEGEGEERGGGGEGEGEDDFRECLDGWGVWGSCLLL
ncbi:unnamed protein product [Closterium sp. NIES-65]|nr:unnamed protein product [Closterium sp. NIES-65]